MQVQQTGGHCFSEALVEQYQRYMYVSRELQISDEQAQEQLNSLADLFLIFADQY